jgi:hypothetical protein
MAYKGQANGTKTGSLIVLDGLIAKHSVVTPWGPETSNFKILTSWQFTQATKQGNTHDETEVGYQNIYRKAAGNSPQLSESLVMEFKGPYVDV